MADAVREPGRLLLAVLDPRTEPRHQVVDMVALIDLAALVDVARVHGVLGLVHRRLVDAGVELPEPVAVRLERERVLTAARSSTPIARSPQSTARSITRCWS